MGRAVKGKLLSILTRLQKAKPTAEILLWNEATGEGDLPPGTVTVDAGGVTLKPAE
jgi:hypothetical protein